MSGSRLAPILNVHLLIKLSMSACLPFLLVAGLCGVALSRTTQTANPQTADDYFKRGNGFLNKGNFEKAIADYTEALRLDPQLAKAYFNRALAHFNLKDYVTSIADSTQAIKINPQYAEAYHNRGTANGSIGRYTEALADIDQAIKINPQMAEAYFSRGVVNNALGNNDRAIADYSQAVNLDPKLAKAYHHRGLGYHRNKDYELAISDFTQAITLTPNEFMGYWARGGVYAEKKEYDRAIADLTKTISLAPKDTRVYSKRAEVYCAQGKKDLASADEKKIIELGGSLIDKCDSAGVSQPVVRESSSTPRFEDYPATQKPKGMPATAIIASRRARLYRTVIRRDARAGPNFAGNYTIAQWGCGSTCVAFAIVDGHTGRVYFHPQVLQAMQVPYQAENVLQFRPDSRLLVIAGEILPLDPNRPTGPETVGKFYYEWKNNRLVLIGKAEIKMETGAPTQAPPAKGVTDETN